MNREAYSNARWRGSGSAERRPRLLLDQRTRPAGMRSRSDRLPARALTIACAILLGLTSTGLAAAKAAKPAPPKSPPALTGNTLLAKSLAGPLSGVDEIMFAARKLNPTDGHWYANFSYYAHDPARKAYGEGTKLYRLNLRTQQLTTIFADPAGGVRDPQVHYDGRKILFAYRKGGEDPYHLWEINADGTDLKQLTDGVFDDFEPSYLPDGRIVFVSSRCKRWVNCWLTQVAVLHVCDADGKNIRAISSNNEHDNTPWPLADGRILYTRWEYVDRSQVHYHHLWAANPDGTAQTIWFGNLHPGITMIDAKPIPGSHKIVASFSPGHGMKEHQGVVTVVNPDAGPDDAPSAKAISKKPDCRDPWAFSEDCFLAARGPSLVLLNGNGVEQVVFRLPDADRSEGLECHEPRPLTQRPREVALQSRIHPAQPTGRMILANVYDGRNMADVKPGEIKKLLVLETLPMPIHYTGGMEPISYGGTFTLERILGTVPVAEDGSAYFEVPALRSVFFVALDENDLAVKRMQSFVTLQPGETTSCVGCHEQRTRTPRNSWSDLAAMRRSPSRIEPVKAAPDVVDFPRDIQPILDRLCVDCHGYEKTARGGPRSGRLLLTGDHGPKFSHSYYMLTIARLFSDGRNQPTSNYAPRTLGSSASRLLTMLDGTHHDVRATPEEKTKLRLWIESGAAYPGTYAALGCGMIGNYAENQQINKDDDWPTTTAGAAVLQERCAGCHDKPSRLLPLSMADERGVSFWQPSMDDPRLLTSRHIVFNLSRPEQSLLLLAPLAESAGGWGLCRDPRTTNAVTVFTDTQDPGYQKLLAMVRAGREFLEKESTRFDMPHFRPRMDWVREMKRYGILPADLSPGAPVDVYATERKYWQSLWYAPVQDMAQSSAGR